MSALKISDLEYFTVDAATIKGGQPFKLELRSDTKVQIVNVVDIKVGSTPKNSSFKIGSAYSVASGIAASFGTKSILELNIGASVG